jgi:hypothetical protein
MPYIVSDYCHSPLYVLVPYFNPLRFRSREKHYERFARYVKDSGGVLVTIEAAFADRHASLDQGETQHGTPIHQAAPEQPAEFHKARTTNPHQYITVRANSELWIKESLLNIGLSRLPSDWEYAAWVDADVQFARPNWVGETIHQLMHYKIVQMFSECVDVGPRYAIVGEARKGFVWSYLHDYPQPEQDPDFIGYHPPPSSAKPSRPPGWHPGFSWAARRDAIDDLGGLIDFAVLGAADNHMAWSLIGRADHSIHPKIHPRYRQLVKEWEWKAEQFVKRNIGYVSGLLVHYWHGTKLSRGYWQRWKILTEQQYNPDTDILRDSQGLVQLVDRNDPRTRILRDRLQRYGRSRNEDSISLEGTVQDQWTF